MMPHITGHLDTGKGLLDDRRFNLIETSTATTSKNGCSRVQVLYKKIMRMKFNKDIIVMGKFTHRQQITGGFRNMKDIIES
jgi:hypothetical protein